MNSVAVWLLLPLASCFATQEVGIIYPRMLSSRADTGEKVIKLTDDITLNLEKSTVFPKEFLVHTTVDGTPARFLMSGEDAEANLYHDTEHMASLDVAEEDGLEILGVIGHTLRIKPMPEMERSMDGQKAHMLYHADEPELFKEEHDKDYGIPKDVQARAAKVSPTGPDTANGTDIVHVEERAERYRLPRKIYPEVHVVTDFLYCQAYGFDRKKIVNSIAIMANAANLRFASLRMPRVHILIVGITVTQTVQEEQYMVHVPGYQSTRNILYDHTLWNFTVHVRKQAYFPYADIVFLVTARNLSEWENNKLVTWVGGYAYPGTVCTAWKVGMSEERPLSFYGVYVFAHELAHVLGCMHDGSPPKGWPPGMIGSEDCPWDDGYMMSYKFVDPNMYRFSRCCSREIMNFYNRPNYTCLHLVNRKRKPYYLNRFPGKKLNRDLFCKKVYYENDYGKADTAWGTKNCCFKCYYKRSSKEFKYAYVVDGTPCGSGTNVCILGNCTTRPTIKRYE
uniref:Putative salivary gland metalloprotease n=1 Tax=Amblyomma parvum TaxID=251391 RepID=A0A023FYW1_AMBPA